MENGTIKRISFSDSIEGCLIGLDNSLKETMRRIKI